MKTYIKQMCACILLGLSVTVMQGQSGTNLFIGIQPEVNFITNSESGLHEVLLPSLVVQAGFNDVVNLRLSTIARVTSGQFDQVSHFGIQAGLPLYFPGKRDIRWSGFYIAPLAGFIHDRKLGNREIMLAVEPGYTWCFPAGFTMNLGIQMGNNLYTGYDTESFGWGDHIHGVFSLGYTFKSSR